ncbi:MAG TPA: FHA domain-containing protein [Polyangia bacterium]
MKLLQLTAIVRDVQTATMVAQSFTRSPVLVGRQFGNQLRLDAGIVSRRHGALLFSKDGAQYIDYNSANGSIIDGARVPPNVPVDVRNTSLITIAPFQIVVHLDLVETGRVSHDPSASTPMVALLRPRSSLPDDRAWKDVFDGGPSVLPAGALRESLERAERAARVIRAMAERMLLAGSRTAATLSPLRLATTPEQMVTLLLDPTGADERLAELRELLAELFRPRLSSVP